VTQLLTTISMRRKYRSPCFGNGSQPLLAAVESSRETMFRALPFCKIRDAHGLHNSSVSLSISVNPRNLPHPAPATPLFSLHTLAVLQPMKPRIELARHRPNALPVI
jgi:hypothetical protein